MMHGHAPTALPVGVLLTAERRRPAVGPAHLLRAVVGRVHHDRVVGDAEFVDLVEQLADVAVVLDHAVRIHAQAGLALRLLLQVREDVHPGRIPPAEEGLVVGHRLVDELQAGVEELFVDRLHALDGQRARVLDLLRPSAFAQLCSTPRGPELLLELGILRVVHALGFLLGVQVIQVAEELVEAVHRGQEFIAVAEVVLAELSGHVAERLEQVGDGRILRLEAHLGAGQADLGQAGADRRLARDERSAAGGAALLAVPIREHRAFLGDAIDVRGLVAHDAVVVGADIEPADVVAPDDQDVRLTGLRHLDAPLLLLCLVRRGVGAESVDDAGRPSTLERSADRGTRRRRRRRCCVACAGSLMREPCDGVVALYRFAWATQDTDR